MLNTCSPRWMFASSLAAVAVVALITISVPAGPAVGASSASSAVADGATQIAEAIRKAVKAQGRDKTSAELMKMFGLKTSDPASAYMADAQVLDGLRAKPPLPGLPAAKQAQMLAELYLAARMEGKGAGAVEGKLEEAMGYARGEKPLHELNAPPADRGGKETCPHPACNQPIARQGQVSVGSKTYDQYACDAGHETLLRVK